MKTMMIGFLALGMVLTGLVSAAEKSVSQNGLKITVKETVSDTPGYSAYAVEAKNTTSGPKTLNGELTTSEKSCTVYLEVPAGETVSKVFKCRGSSAGWMFKVIKVYNFINK